MSERPAQANFRSKTLDDLLKHNFQDSKTTLSTQASSLVNELLVYFVQELGKRAMEQASVQGATTVEIEHFEKILPQLLLDFS